MQTTLDSTTPLSSSEDLSFLSPEHTAARTIQQIERNQGERPMVSREAIAALLETECKAVADGDLTMVRRTLAAQIRVLQRLHDHLLDRAMSMGAVVEAYERYLNLAFRAQTQLNRTIALLERYHRQEKVEKPKLAPKPTPPRGEPSEPSSNANNTVNSPEAEDVSLVV